MAFSGMILILSFMNICVRWFRSYKGQQTHMHDKPEDYIFVQNKNITFYWCQKPISTKMDLTCFFMYTSDLSPISDLTDQENNVVVLIS
jgi:hypothetical protein